MAESWTDPCLDAERMRALDRWAINEQGVPSLELMEAAGRAVAEVAGELAGGGPARIVCGKGNNGGDGLVAGRYLADAGIPTDVLLLAEPSELSGDAAINLKRVPGARTVDAAALGDELKGSGIVIDAIFGTGFAGEPREQAAVAIEAINASGAPVVAADIASGVDASNGEIRGAAVQASTTVTFHAPKLGHWIAPGKWVAGALRVVPIGIPVRDPFGPSAGLIADRVLSLAPRRGSRSTKFSSGRVVVVGGSRGKTGAVCLAASAAIRSGAGYVTVAVPGDLEPIFETKLTEVMTLGLASRESSLRAAASDQVLAGCKEAGAVVLGPGLGDAPGTARLARELAQRIEAPLVLDADGLNAHARELGSLAERRAPTVLTPHSGELARMLGCDSDHTRARRLECAREAANVAAAVVVHKGDDTIVTDGERIAINPVSSPGLATAGTGDVLGGMIAALIARGMDHFEAACAAVLAHSRAGVFAAELHGAESVIATDVIAAIGAGLRVPSHGTTTSDRGRGPA